MIPNILYKYLDIDAAVTMISNHNIQFTRSTQLNDPFDCHEELLDFTNPPENLCTQYTPSLTTKIFRETIGKARENIYICSLSKVFDSILMWSYYNSHRGVCIGLNINDIYYYLEKLDTAPSPPFEVKYRETINKLNYFSPKEKAIKYFVETKSADWKHEEEVRMFLTQLPHSKSNYYRATILPRHFHAVYLGVNISPENKIKVIETISQLNTSINIYQMEPDIYSFKLKYNQIL